MHGCYATSNLYEARRVRRKKKEDAAPNAVCSSEKTALKIGNLMVIELRKAEEEIVRWVQRTSFPDVYRALANMLPGSSKRQVRKVIQKEGSSIFKLNRKLRNGLLSVDGGLESAPIDEDLKHPFILPSHHHVGVAYPVSPQPSGPPRSRIRSLIPEGKVLGCERTFCSASHVEEMF